MVATAPNEECAHCLANGTPGMEYFVGGFGMDANDNILLSGYSRSDEMSFGDIGTLQNPMHPSEGGDGQNTVYTIRISHSNELPSCLDECVEGVTPTPTSGCLIANSVCYADGEPSPYSISR